MGGVEVFEQALVGLVRGLKLILEVTSTLCILLGLVAVVRRGIRARWRHQVPPFTDLRVLFGSWLALALEFQLGSDILATTVSPSFKALGELAAIAAIRTFLNYFLNKELEAAAELKKASQPNTTQGLP